MKLKKYSESITWDVILFFALYIIMPSYFAFEVSSSLPLITASRLVLVMIGMMLIIRRRDDIFHYRKLSVKNLNLLLCDNPILRFGLFAYFVLLLIVNLCFVFETTEAIKSIFVLLAEEFALVWILSLVIDTKEKLLSCLKVLIYASGVTALIATISSVIDRNLFYLLNTVQRDTLMASYYRLGLLRAEAGFGHPVYYGAFCAVIIPLNMYFVEESKKTHERLAMSACLVLNLVGLVLSNSRGSMLAMGCTAAIMLVVKLIMKPSKRIILTYFSIICTTAATLVLVAALSPVGISFLGGIGESISNVFFPIVETIPPATTVPGATEAATVAPETTEAATVAPETIVPETTVGAPDKEGVSFGDNAGGLWSRAIQLTGIIWTMKHNPVFGLGPNAHTRGLVAYEINEGQWWTIHSVDSAPVAIICQYGLLGAVGYVILYLIIAYVLLRNRKDKLILAMGFTYISYYLCLLSISSLDKCFWVITALLVCYINLMHKDTDKK